MNTIMIKFRFILIVLMVFFLFVIVFVDSNSLNALLSDDEYTLLVDEVNVLNVDYDKVVYADNSNNNVTITNNCVIGAGAVVVKDIKESGTYIGIPVKELV